MEQVFFYDSPVGKLGLAEEEGSLTRVFFHRRETPAGGTPQLTPLLKKAASQLAEYFEGRRKVFDLPLALRGTGFQLAVWEALQNIPFGEKRCYGELAALAGNPRACRAAGMANNRNPLAIIIPCHRVIGKDGSLTGYAGGLPVKQYLLDLEERFR
ncbi:MAG: methylated-DNA--[protein]-cysteine S-methyltransferase [Treponema sp.]|jgi:methylated-DNA-[protein]-cysteine S-methyltransferase|nr:methylated-DNA--[protein]-cysteine S-methyltransferase [Treponema sp.]